MLSTRTGRRPLAVRLIRFIWRCLRVLLMAFAGIGPAPPRLLPPPPASIELRVEDPRRSPIARRR